MQDSTKFVGTYLRLRNIADPYLNRNLMRDHDSFPMSRFASALFRSAHRHQ